MKDVIEPARVPTTFHQGRFELGNTTRREVTDCNSACEYDLLSYLAAATAGQRVGVGTLHCQVEMSEAEYNRTYRNSGIPFREGASFWVHEVNLVVIPDVGIWVCEPVFRDAADSLERAESGRDVVVKKVGAELPLGIALIGMIPDITPSLKGIDPAVYFDTQLFADVTGTLTRRASPTPNDLVRVIDDVLATGTWLDAKRDFYDDWELPRWVAELIYP